MANRGQKNTQEGAVDGDVESQDVAKNQALLKPVWPETKALVDSLAKKYDSDKAVIWTAGLVLLSLASQTDRLNTIGAINAKNKTRSEMAKLLHLVANEPEIAIKWIRGLELPVND